LLGDAAGTTAFVAARSLVGTGTERLEDGGQNVLAEGVRQDVKPYNIRTTMISPGAVATELANSVIEPDIAEDIRSTMKGSPSSHRSALT
jgi:NAD(P)-dependent dehydrogenase (short-subunit alcohol dehydrogenase family)